MYRCYRSWFKFARLLLGFLFCVVKGRPHRLKDRLRSPVHIPETVTRSARFSSVQSCQGRLTSSPCNRSIFWRKIWALVRAGVFAVCFAGLLWLSMYRLNLLCMAVGDFKAAISKRTPLGMFGLVRHWSRMVSGRLLRVRVWEMVGWDLPIISLN